MSWIGVCDAEQVQEDFPYSGNIDGKEIGIYLIDGEYYALEDVCPHAYALLSQGFVEDGKVECPLHEAVFDVKTGQCLHGPGGRNLNRYPVRVYDNQIRLPLSRRTWHERIPGLQPGATGKPPVYATGGRRKRQYP
ncbi:non-heme iron oxygenase ferredoxin subunit [Klebsiella pneumoniae]|nr:non-heme iron oxygenase ferredoxin subunit [Klebsiella pneumoniae]